jgi:hypothetical protein
VSTGAGKEGLTEFARGRGLFQITTGIEGRDRDGVAGIDVQHWGESTAEVVVHRARAGLQKVMGQSSPPVPGSGSEANARELSATALLRHTPTTTLLVSTSMLTASELQQTIMVSKMDKTYVRLLTFWMSTICEEVRSG